MAAAAGVAGAGEGQDWKFSNDAFFPSNFFVGVYLFLGCDVDWQLYTVGAPTHFSMLLSLK